MSVESFVFRGLDPVRLRTGRKPSRGALGGRSPPSVYFLPAFFLPAMVLRGPLLERALVRVR